MANSYKFKGVALATASETTLITAASNETIIIKSIRITNNTGNTPTVSMDVADNSASAEFRGAIKCAFSFRKLRCTKNNNQLNR